MTFSISSKPPPPQLAKAFIQLEKCSDILACHLDIVTGVVYGAASAASRPNLPLRYRKAIT